MNYNGLQYSWVNETLQDGVEYTAWRCDTDPTLTIITYEDQIVESSDLKSDWLALCGVDQVAELNQEINVLQGEIDEKQIEVAQLTQMSPPIKIRP